MNSIAHLLNKPLSIQVIDLMLAITILILLIIGAIWLFEFIFGKYFDNEEDKDDLGS